MSFFITSRAAVSGTGNLGGLSAADALCQKLAVSVGVGQRTWRAYLSTSTAEARGRIGDGPWFNARGVMVAQTLADRHDQGKLSVTSVTGLDETGKPVPGGGGDDSEHDIITGTGPAGRKLGGNCSNWTSDSGEVTVGHHDHDVHDKTRPERRWNSAHASDRSRAGLLANRGTGRFYCFALPAPGAP
jgi:hypothetical protein